MLQKLANPARRPLAHRPAYVLRNPIRAQLVESVTQCPWSNLHDPTLTDPSPVPLPDNPLHWID
ncbi:MAG: hypothetical protein CAF42_004850 [Nitrospira sp. CG24B]|nr:MAG: hypothetical protein CAF42_004850 [Nitrospira sp. CG24B]